jgi:hypothetical protein
VSSKSGVGVEMEQFCDAFGKPSAFGILSAENRHKSAASQTIIS